MQRPSSAKLMLDNNVIPSVDQAVVKRVPANYKIPYCKISLFKENEESLLYNKRYWKVSISVGLGASKMPPLILSSTQLQSRTLSRKTSTRQNDSKQYRRMTNRH